VAYLTNYSKKGQLSKYKNFGVATIAGKNYATPFSLADLQQ